MLTGQAPFAAPTPNAILYAHVNKPPALLSQLNPAIPKPVEAVVLRALAKRPDDRFQSVAEFASTLEQVTRQAGDDVAVALYRDARGLITQGKFDEAQDKLDQLRQINPNYPGQAELATEIARQAQIAREYGEIVQLNRQARERATDFARRVPSHPDPERVLKPPVAVMVEQRGGSGWSVVWVAGLMLAIGGVLGFWAVPAEGRWAWGGTVLFSALLGKAIVTPWVILIGIMLAAGIGMLAALVRHKMISRGLALVGSAIAVLSFLLTVVLARSMGVEGPGPTLALVGQVILGIGLVGSVWRGA
jgi:tetratricopeptide (TPR) repeat protein